MKVVLITQARVGSSRLPGKVLKKIGNESLLDIHLKRLKKTTKVDEIVVATTHEDRSDQICEVAENQNVSWYKGDLEDVLDRFYQAAKSCNADWVVRVTSDCPLLDWKIVDEVVQKALDKGVDYCANILVEDFPDGQDVEVFKMTALEVAWRNAKKTFEREHVTPYIRNSSDFKGEGLFTALDVSSPVDYHGLRMTVDEPADFEMMTWLINTLGTERGWEEYVAHMLANPNMLVNADIIRNEGYLKSLKKKN